MPRRLAAALLTLAGSAPEALAQHGDDGGAPLAAAVAPSATTGQAIRAVRAPTLDGRDTDAVWASAPVIDQFRQFVPVEDGDPSFRTEARVAYDDRNLYVLVRAHDPHPDSIVSLLSRRDVRTTSDQIKVIIDSYHDRRTGVEFAVNPAGVKRDASIYDDVVEDLSWDGVWDVATAVDSLGWVAEFRIPFSQLRFTSRPAHTFGFGVWRDVARTSERTSWPLYRTSRTALASQLGTLGGIVGISRASRLELLPYVVARSESELRADEWGREQKVSAGADLKLGVTDGLTLDATVNPDFGQVEADPAVLNLTAFEVQFEERRPFFLEGVGLFRCGGPCEGIFYTRRIGRTPQLRTEPSDPTSTAILGAAKLTGRVGRGLSLGLVEAVTRREVGSSGTTIEPQTSYFVGRAYQELRGGRSGLGLMVTAVNRKLDEVTVDTLRRDAYTALVQGFHRFLDERFELMGYAGYNRVGGSERAIAATQANPVHLYQRPDHEQEFDSTRTGLGGGVASAQVRKLGGNLRFLTNLRYASAGMELNDLGFVTLVNDMSIRNSIDLQATRPRRYFRTASASLETEQHWSPGGLPTGALAAVETNVELPNYWAFSLDVEATELARTHCVSCARGGPALRLSPGWSTDLAVDGDPRQVVVPHVFARYESGDEGRSSARSVDGTVDLRIASRFSMSLGSNAEWRTDDAQWVENFGALLSDTTHYTFARLRQTTVGVTARADFAATPTLSLQLYAQPFLSSGSFTDWRELRDPRAAAYDDRFQPYGDGAAPDGFSFKQFNSNVVARWEYRPGSTLFLVWQQGRTEDAVDAGSFRLQRDYRNLFRVHPENTFLIKVSYWFNP